MYRFSGLIKACTAIVSWITVFVLIRFLPEALKLPSTALLAQELQRSKERLDFALDAGQIGVWEWNLKTDTLLWDRRTRQIFNIDPEMRDLYLTDFTQCLHPEDRNEVTNQLEQCIQTRTPYNSKFRVIHSDGSIRYVHAQGRAFLGNDGEPEQYIGVCHEWHCRCF
ncbi:MAG TPA: hypothetical protein DIT97_33995, partial [Gimesia maris]|nr:hypothetical protein [Gimesia maris]